MLSLTVLGSTGSIGTQTLQVAAERGWRVAAIAAGKNLDLLAEQLQHLPQRPEAIAVSSEKMQEAKSRFAKHNLVSLEEVATWPADVTVNAIGGQAGLLPTRQALEAGRRVALATKEAMVTAAPLVWAAAKAGGGALVPIDSEHTGLYQCLVGERLDDVAEVILTASGGPFLQQPSDLSTVTPAQALKHPNWNMGAKISIDSATLVNKGLEMLECAALYGISADSVKVVMHPQSALHAAVRWKDGNLSGNFGAADMKLFIAYAILAAAAGGMREAGEVIGPTDRGVISVDSKSMRWPLLGEWHFFEPDTSRFPALRLAYEAGKKGGLFPAAYNSSDEVAVAAFLAKKIRFTDISRIIETVLSECPSDELSWSSLAATHAWATRRAQELSEA